jgi:chemotaxis signal transduction protein
MSPSEVRRAGLVFRSGEDHWFVPASVASRIEPTPPLARVPGAPDELAGLAHLGGEIIPVLALQSKSPTAVVVCSHLGENVALAVDAVVHTGAVEPDREYEGVLAFPGGRARPLDLASLCGRLRMSAWTAA